MTNYAMIRIIKNIVNNLFPDKSVFTEEDIRRVIIEFNDNGHKYGTEEGEYKKALKSSKGAKTILQSFVEYLVARAAANLDTMIVCTGSKGVGKSSASIMIAKAYCDLLGIKFDPDKFICYSNAQLLDRIVKLPKFSPIIADEAINFACVTGDSKVLISDGREIPIKELEFRRDFYVWTFNTVTKKREVKKAFGCRKIKKEKVYEVKLSTGEKLTCTNDHKFLVRKGMEYKELKDIIWGNYVEQVKKKQYNKKAKNSFRRKRSKEYDDSIMTFIETYHTPREWKGLPAKPYIRSIKYKGIEDVYEILGVEDNDNYVVNNIICRNSSENWAKAENKILKQRLGQIRTRHLLFILCFPMKIQKIDKVYLENYCQYWVDLFGRGIGALYTRDKNPAHDTWRIKDFGKLGAYTEFTHAEKVQDILSKHPNFWSILKFPKPSEKLYSKYLKVREKNIYDDPEVMKSTNKEDVIKAIMIITLKELLTRDSSLSVNRMLLHLENKYGMRIDKALFDSIMKDSKMLIKKLEENNLLDGGIGK